MKKVLLDILICPGCLPEENSLEPTIIQEQGHDILCGHMTCYKCGKVYPIRDGIAFLEPHPPQKPESSDNKYETAQALSSYIWSHYCDIIDDEGATDAYCQWAQLMDNISGVAIDAGSAVGRFVFEMSKKSDFVVGIDNSYSFIHAARELMTNRSMKIALKQEGLILREINLILPETWDSDKVEFIIGDAQALPFRSKTISSFSSLNLIDKVPFPIKHLKELNRVTRAKDAQCLVSDPFSWSTEVANEEDWLGGKTSGEYAGAGIDNLTSLLDGNGSMQRHRWDIERRGHVWWKIRSHSNHFELIRSCFVKAKR